MKNKYNLIISLIASTIINIFFIPIKLETTNKTFFGRDNIFNILNQNKCKYCYSYDINYIWLIIQFIIIVLVALLILKLIDKRRKKK